MKLMAFKDEKKTDGGDREALRKDLAAVLNRHSAENGSDTPDFILADYLMGCLDAFNATAKRREEWYGRVKEEVEAPHG